MNLFLAMALGMSTVYVLAHILALLSLILDKEFMLQYEREFWRMERRRTDRRNFLNSIS
jgi:hypothetical protein